MLHSIDTTEIAIPTKRNYLISGPVDILLMGGLSIIFFILLSFVFQQQQPSPTLLSRIFFLSFIVNFPHFLSSYQMLYIDSRHLILKNSGFFVAAIIVPLVLVSIFMGAIFYQEKSVLGFMANAMFFLVGWHYVKQVFGTIVVSNALQSFYYKKMERWALQANLYCIWAVSWLSVNTQSNSYEFSGINYKTLHLPVGCLTTSYCLLFVTWAIVIITHLQKYLRERVLPSHSAIVSFSAVYIWLLPALYNPVFFYLIPFFHSLQYLPFVYAFRRNKIKDQLGTIDSSVKVKRYLVQVYGYMLLSVVTGAVFFWYLPNYIDRSHFFNNVLYDSMLAMFVFTVFINIHHFFIDNVTWKKNNPEIKKYLFR